MRGNTIGSTGTPMNERLLVKKDHNHFLVNGDLGFESVPKVLKESYRLFENGSDIVIDLAGIGRADSAGLALLLEWLDIAKKNNRSIEFKNIPEQLLAIARTSGIDHIIMN